MGDTQLVDGMIYDGFLVHFHRIAFIWGLTETRQPKNLSLTREAQDEWSFRSHERALQAIDNRLIRRRNCSR